MDGTEFLGWDEWVGQNGAPCWQCAFLNASEDNNAQLLHLWSQARKLTWILGECRVPICFSQGSQLGTALWGLVSPKCFNVFSKPWGFQENWNWHGRKRRVPARSDSFLTEENLILWKLPIFWINSSQDNNHNNQEWPSWCRTTFMNIYRITSLNIPAPCPFYFILMEGDGEQAMVSAEKLQGLFNLLIPQWPLNRKSCWSHWWEQNRPAFAHPFPSPLCATELPAVDWKPYLEWMGLQTKATLRAPGTWPSELATTCQWKGNVKLGQITGKLLLIWPKLSRLQALLSVFCLHSTSSKHETRQYQYTHLEMLKKGKMLQLHVKPLVIRL